MNSVISTGVNEADPDQPSLSANLGVEILERSDRKVARHWHPDSLDSSDLFLSIDVAKLDGAHTAPATHFEFPPMAGLSVRRHPIAYLGLIPSFRELRGDIDCPDFSHGGPSAILSVDHLSPCLCDLCSNTLSLIQAHHSTVTCK
jgi:hypothetical protein